MAFQPSVVEKEKVAYLFFFLNAQGNLIQTSTAFNSPTKGRSFLVPERPPVPMMIPDGMAPFYNPFSAVNGYAHPFQSNIYPPDASTTLYVEGLPLDATEREVAHIFRPFPGYQSVRILRKESKQNPSRAYNLCFIEFDSKYQATIAMNALHGYRMDKNDTKGLKITYAKTERKERRSSSGGTILEREREREGETDRDKEKERDRNRERNRNRDRDYRDRDRERPSREKERHERERNRNRDRDYRDRDRDRPSRERSSGEEIDIDNDEAMFTDSNSTPNKIFS